MFLRILWIYTITMLYCNCQTTTLTPVDPDVVKGNDITLVCTISSVVNYVNWVLAVDTTSLHTQMGVQNGACAISPPTSNLSDTTKYSYNCTSTVYQVTVKNVQRSQHNNVWSCYPFPLSSGPTSTINVQVPVSSVSKTPSSTTLNVIVNTVREFTCQTSASRPDASVTWFKVESGVTSQINQNITSKTASLDDYVSVTTSTLKFVPSRQQDGVQILCKAANTVNTIPIQSAKNTLNVLYPPEVQNIENMSLIEGSTLDYNCLFTAGVPKETSVRWIREIDTSTWNDTHLVIQSVSRKDAGQYICEAFNTMHATGETLSHIGKSQEMFYLEVQYEAKITSFNVDGVQKIVVVDENDVQVHLECIVEGIPTPNISLRKMDEAFEPVVSNRADKILEKASCSDAGEYICSAKNLHNTERISIQHVFLFVRCTPRARDAVVTKRKVEMDHTVTFAFNALAYPYPTFTWWKLVEAKWRQLSNGENILIQSLDLLSNLTIRSVSQADFTYYKVIIKNDIGINEQTYELLQSGNQNTDRKDQNGDFTDIAPVIGYTIGATVGCFILIIMTVFLVRRFYSRKDETNKSKEPTIDRTKVEETAVETAFHNIINDAQESSEPSSQGGMYYNQESSSNYETLDMENQVVSSYSGLETTTSGQTNVEETYVKMD